MTTNQIALILINTFASLALFWFGMFYAQYIYHFIPEEKETGKTWIKVVWGNAAIAIYTTLTIFIHLYFLDLLTIETAIIILYVWAGMGLAGVPMIYYQRRKNREMCDRLNEIRNDDKTI